MLTLSSNSGAVTCVAASSPKIAASGTDGSIRIWDADSGQLLYEPLCGSFSSISCLALSSNGRHLIAGLPDGTLRLWTPEKSQRQATSEFTDKCTLQEDWIQDMNGRPILWVPSAYQKALLWPSNNPLACTESISLDFSRHVGGTGWVGCALEDSVPGRISAH
jgi:WD40 repeat protein